MDTKYVLKKNVRRRTGIVREFMLLLIRFYRMALSPFLGGQCRYYPTCSMYSLECFMYLPMHKAFYFSIKRIFSCHPGNPGGEDYPPGIYEKETETKS